MPKKKIFSIQVMRGLAAMMVVICHSGLQVSLRQGGRSLEFLSSGVDIFFVISGFVIYLTGKNLEPGDFFRRRLIRVAPLYWLFLLCKIAFVAASGSLAQLGSAGYLLSSFLFIPGYRGNGSPVPPITAAWTLNYEMYFYLGFGLLLAFQPKRLLLGSTVWIGLATLAGLWLWHGGTQHPPAPFMLLSPICLEFLAGIGLAEAWMRGLSLPLWVSALLGALAVLWFGLVPDPAMFDQNRVLLWGIPAMALMIAVINSEHVLDYSRWRAALLLGDASYAIYLSHTVVLPLADKIVARLPVPWLGMVIIEAGTSMVAGIAVHLLVERGMTAWLSRKSAPLAAAKPA